MTTLYFAQISDIHISSLGDHHDLLSGRSAEFLVQIIDRLNRMEDLDFVLISGDLFDQADITELQQFQQVIHNLSTSCYIIPGNHDRRAADSTEGLTRRDFARQFNPQFEHRPHARGAQAGYWSISLNSEVQLIGLDSIRDDDWGGVIDMLQFKWLKNELERHVDKLVIVAVHHPLHPLAPIDQDPAWSNFVCDNGPQILRLFDQHPQVKLVLTGHHHVTKVDTLGSRLHLACPSICIYPCAYRTFRLTRQADDTWQITWRIHNATDEATIAEARNAMINTWQEIGFEANFVEEHVALALGNDHDRNGSADLT